MEKNDKTDKTKVLLVIIAISMIAYGLIFGIVLLVSRQNERSINATTLNESQQQQDATIIKTDTTYSHDTVYIQRYVK